jgi:hypothetical protein
MESSRETVTRCRGVRASRAYGGTTRCGVTSVQRTGSFSGFSLTVVGPQSVAGCTAGAKLTFRVDGRPTADTAINELVTTNRST